MATVNKKSKALAKFKGKAKAGKGVKMADKKKC